MKRNIFRHLIFILLMIFILGQSSEFFAETPKFSSETRKYILYQSSVIALKNVNLIKGDGSPAQPDQTVIIQDGRIAKIGDTSTTQIPENPASHRWRP